MRILLIEDDCSLAEAVAELLKNEGFIVDFVHEGKLGYDFSVSGIYDLFLIDVMLPGMNGFEILRKLRQQDIHTPTIMLTAKAELDDKLAGFESGADDYITKPFMTKELIARIWAVLKRQNTGEHKFLTFHDLELRNAEGTLHNTLTNKSIALGPKELYLMEAFLAHPSLILSKEILTERAWGYDSDSEYNNIEVYVSFLRKKIVALQSQVQIKSIRGIGYKLEYTS